MSDLKTAIRMLSKSTDEVYSVVGRVLAIDESKRICDVEPYNGDAIVFDVRLQAEEDQKNGMVLIPEKDSTVVVTFLGKNHGYVAERSAVSKVLIVVEGQTLEYSKDGLSLFSDQAKFAEQVDFLIATLGKLIDTLLQFQLSTNVGPTITVMPQVVALLNQHKADFETAGQKLKTMLY